MGQPIKSGQMGGTEVCVISPLIPTVSNPSLCPAVFSFLQSQGPKLVNAFFGRLLIECRGTDYSLSSSALLLHKIQLFQDHYRD